MNMNPEQIDPHNYPGPLEELERENRLKGVKEGNDNSRSKIMIIIALSLLVCGGLIAALFAYKEGAIDNDFIENPEGLVSFVPFWIAIFIPFIFVKKKKSENKISNERRLLIILVALGVLSAIGLGLFVVVSEL